MKSTLLESTVCLQLAGLVNNCVPNFLPQGADYTQSRSAGRSVDTSVMETKVLSVLNNNSQDDVGTEFITAVSVNIG
jgi:spore coat polysaccharide biosynthesis protein SpsF (cytidylyltransferase family)